MLAPLLFPWPHSAPPPFSILKSPLDMGHIERARGPHVPTTAVARKSSIGGFTFVVATEHLNGGSGLRSRSRCWSRRCRRFLGGVGVGFLTTLGVGVGYFRPTPTPDV